MQILKTKEIKPADFHSDIEVNLDGTDEKDLYDRENIRKNSYVSS